MAASCFRRIFWTRLGELLERRDPSASLEGVARHASLALSFVPQARSILRQRSGRELHLASWTMSSLQSLDLDTLSGDRARYIRRVVALLHETRADPRISRRVCLRRRDVGAHFHRFRSPNSPGQHYTFRRRSGSRACLAPRDDHFDRCAERGRARGFRFVPGLRGLLPPQESRGDGVW